MKTERWMPSRRPARRNWLWLAFALLIAVPHAGRPDDKPPANQVQTILQKLKTLLMDSKVQNVTLINTIVVALDPTGHLTYVNFIGYPVKPGTYINWVSMDGALTVTPLGKSPLVMTPIYSKPYPASGGGTLHVAAGQIATTATAGSYPYVIALDYGGKPYVDVNCPPIIVE